MDFHAMNRRRLQALCKKHGVPANKSNLEMANLLTSLLQESEKLPSQESSVVVDSDGKDVEKNVKRVRFSPDNEIRVYEPSAYKVSRRRTRSVGSLDVDGESVVRRRQSREKKEDKSGVLVRKRGRGGKKMDDEESGPNDGMVTRQLRNRKIVSEESGGKNEGNNAKQRKRKNEKTTKENTSEVGVAEPENVPSRPKRNVRKKGSEEVEEIRITWTVASTQAKAESSISTIEDKETQGISGRSLRQKSVSSLNELQSEAITGNDAEVQKAVRRRSKRNVANLVDSQPSMTVESKQVVSGRMTRSRAPVTRSPSPSDDKDVVQVKDLKRTRGRNASRGRSAIPKKVIVTNDEQDVKENRNKSDNLDVEVVSAEVLDKPSLPVQQLRRSRREITVSEPSVTIDEGVICQAVRNLRHKTKRVSDKDQHATVETVQINKKVSGLGSKVKNGATNEITGKRIKAGQLKQKVAEVDKEVSVALDEFVVGPPVPNEVAEMKQNDVPRLSLVTEDNKSNQVLSDDELLAGFTGMTVPAEKSCSDMNSGEELKPSSKARSSMVRSGKKRRNDSAADSYKINLVLEGNMASLRSKALTASEETMDTKQTLCEEEALTKDAIMTEPEALENKNSLRLNSKSEPIRNSHNTSNSKSRSNKARRNRYVHDSDMQLNIVCYSDTTSVLEGNMASTQFKSVADSADERALASPRENGIVNETNNSIINDTENLVSTEADDVARSTAKQNSAEAELTGETMNHSQSCRGLMENELSSCRVIIHEILSADEALTGCTGMTTPAEKSRLNVNSCTELLKSSNKMRSYKVRSSQKRRNNEEDDSAMHLDVADSSNINLDLEGNMASLQSKLTSSEETRDTKQTLCDEEALTKDIGMTKSAALGNKHCLSLNSKRGFIKSSDKMSSFKSRSSQTRRNNFVHDSDMQLNIACHSNTTTVLEGNMSLTQIKSVADSIDESALASPSENQVIVNETNNIIIDDTENLVPSDLDVVARSAVKENSAEAELTGETTNHSQSDKGLMENELSSSRVIIHEILSADEALTGYTGMSTPAKQSCLNMSSCMELLESSKVRSSQKRRNNTEDDSAMHLDVVDSSNINLDFEGDMASPQLNSLTSSDETKETKQTLCDEEALTKDVGMTKSAALGNEHCLSSYSKGELIKSFDKTSSFKSGSSRTRKNDSVHDPDMQLNIVCHSNTTSVLEGNMASTQFKALADSADEKALAFPRENEEIVNETNNTIVDVGENLVSVDMDDVARSTAKQNLLKADLTGLQSNSKFNIPYLANQLDVEGKTVNPSQPGKGLMENELSPCRVMIHEKDEPVDTSTKVDGSFTLDLEQSLQNAVSNEHEKTERRSYLDSDIVHPLYMNVLQDSMNETSPTPDRHAYSATQYEGTIPMLKEDAGDQQDNVLTQKELEVSSEYIKMLHVEKNCNTEMAGDSNDYGTSICMQCERSTDLGCAMGVEFGDFSDSQMVATKEMTGGSPELIKEVLLELPDLDIQEKTMDCSLEREVPVENGREHAAVGSLESLETIFTCHTSPQSKCSMGSDAGSAGTSNSLESIDTLSDKEIKSIMINYQHSSNSDTLVQDESAQVHTDSLETADTLSNEEIMSMMIEIPNSSNSGERISDPLVEIESSQVNHGDISSGSKECSSQGEEFSNIEYTVPRGSSDTILRNRDNRSGAMNTASEDQMSSDILFSSADVNSELNVLSCHGNEAILSKESKKFNEVDDTPSPTATDVQYMSNAKDMITLQDVQGNISHDQEAKLKEAGCDFKETDIMMPTPPGSIGFMVESMQTKEGSALPTFSSTAVASNLFNESEEDVDIKQIPSPKTNATEEYPVLVPPLIGSPHNYIGTETPLGSAFFSDWDQGNNKEDVIENTANSGSKTGSLEKPVTLSAQVDEKEDKTISCLGSSNEVLAIDNIFKLDGGLMNTSPLKETSGVLRSPPTVDMAPNQKALSPFHGSPEITADSSTVQQQNVHASYVEKSQAQECSNISSDAFKNVVCEGDFTDMSQQFQEEDKVEDWEHSFFGNRSKHAVQLFEIEGDAPDGATLSIVQSKNPVGLENFDIQSPYINGNFSAVHSTSHIEKAAFGVDLEMGETQENAKEVAEDQNENVHLSEQVISENSEIAKGAEFEQQDEMTLQISDIQLSTDRKCQIAFGPDLEKGETQENVGEVAEKEHDENLHQFEQVIPDKPEIDNDMTLEFSDIQLSMKTECQDDESIKSEHASDSTQKSTMIEDSAPKTFLDNATTSERTMELKAIKEDQSLKLVLKLDTSMLNQSPAITRSAIDQGIAQEDCCNPQELLPPTQTTNSDVKKQDTNGSTYQPALPTKLLAESNSHHHENSAMEWKKSRSVLILGTPKKTLRSKESMSKTKMEGIGNMTAPKLWSKRQPLEDLTNNKSN